MATRYVERVRTKLEEIDNLREAVVLTLKRKASDPKRSVIYDYQLKNLLQQIQSNSVDVLNIYKTSSSDMQNELNDIQLQGDNIAGLFSKYYSEVKLNKDYNHRNGIEDMKAETIAAQHYLDTVFDPPMPRPDFSEAEDEGRSVDLQPVYSLYVNLKAVQVPEIDSYLLFLRDIEKIYGSSLSHKLKHYKEYYEFYTQLGSYLVDFHRRIQPLNDTGPVYAKIEAEFEEKYDNKDIDNYFDVNDNDKETETYFCEACQHEFTNHNTYQSHFKGKKHQKNASNVNNLLAKLDGPAETQNVAEAPNGKRTGKKTSRKYKLARSEYICVAYKELLEEEFENALNIVRYKQTAETGYDDNASIKSATEEEEDENKAYGSKNMPIGWDGKPIPMWVYKLHGLGVEHKCEICGNYSYWGRQAFEKHFTEWRHTYGMKCLKIPNTPHFREITSINDALVLHKKLLMEAKYQKFNADNEEEFEDSEGNVLKKRDYEDLKREGLL